MFQVLEFLYALSTLERLCSYRRTHEPFVYAHGIVTDSRLASPASRLFLTSRTLIYALEDFITSYSGSGTSRKWSLWRVGSQSGVFLSYEAYYALAFWPDVALVYRNGVFLLSKCIIRSEAAWLTETFASGSNVKCSNLGIPFNRTYAYVPLSIFT